MHAAVRWLMGVLVLCGSFVVAQQSQAQGNKRSAAYKVAIIDVVGEGVPQDLARQVTEIIKREARRNVAYELVKQEQFDLFESLLLIGCDTPSTECMTLLSQTIGAERLIYGRLVESDGFHDLTVNIFDARREKIVDRWKKRFSTGVNTISFFSREMEIVIGGHEPKEPPRLRIASNIHASKVFIDGRKVGQTPFMTSALPEGKHTVEVTQEGYTTWSRQVELVQGEDTLLKVTLRRGGAGARSEASVVLEPTPIVPVGNLEDDLPPIDGPTGSGRRLNGYGWVALSIGSAALVGGGVMGFLASETQKEFDQATLERPSYDLRAEGRRQASIANGLFAVGGVGLITGVILFALDSGQESPRGGASFSVAPDGDGAAVWWSGSW